jgi:hypothetical protein
MKCHFSTHLDRRGVTRVATAVLLLALSPSARGQAQSAQREKEQQEASWASQHLDLDLLPVAFVVRPGRLSIGGPVNLTPAGFPASTYSLYPNLLYGITPRTEAAFGVTGAERLGPGGQALFYMFGLQHLLVPETRRLPTISLGGYGFLGPHDHNGGAAYLVASRQLTGHAYPRGVFAHLGVELQGFSNADSSAALQPFLGANYVWNRRVRFSTEFRPRMPWERANLYSLRAVILLNRRFGVAGGLRNNGYQTHPFISLHLD